MDVTFDSTEEQASPGDDVTFGFFLENRSDQRFRCAYRVEQTAHGVSPSIWRVDGPTSLASAEGGRGALSVRAPRNPGTEEKAVAIRLLVDTGDPSTDAMAACTLVVGPRRLRGPAKLTPNPDGTVGAKLSLHRRGRAAVDAEVKFRHKGGWRFYPERPSITVHTSSGAVRVVAPRSRWYLPDVTLNPDGTVTVKTSLFNRGGVDVKASVRLRHDDGWWFSPESPELTVKASKGPVDVSATFRPPPGRGANARDQVTVQLQYKGAPVADASVAIRPKGAILKRASVAASLLFPLALFAASAFVNRSNPPAPSPVVATVVSQPPGTIAPSPPATLEQPRPPTTLGRGPSRRDPRPPPESDPGRGVVPTPQATTVAPTTPPTTSPPHTIPPTTRAPDPKAPPSPPSTPVPPPSIPPPSCCVLG